MKRTAPSALVPGFVLARGMTSISNAQCCKKKKDNPSRSFSANSRWSVGTEGIITLSREIWQGRVVIATNPVMPRRTNQISIRTDFGNYGEVSGGEVWLRGC